MKTPAPKILKAGAQHMEDRAALRDSPSGERSMARTVAAFNALEGTTLTETQGWRFLAVLKHARSTQGEFCLDDYEDWAAYAALAGECASAQMPASPCSAPKPFMVADGEDCEDWAAYAALAEECTPTQTSPKPPVLPCSVPRPYMLGDKIFYAALDTKGSFRIIAHTWNGTDGDRQLLVLKTIYPSYDDAFGAQIKARITPAFGTTYWYWDAHLESPQSAVWDGRAVDYAYFSTNNVYPSPQRAKLARSE